MMRRVPCRATDQRGDVAPTKQTSVRWMVPRARPLSGMTNFVRESPSEQTKVCRHIYHRARVKGDA
jgi:hypothetical protein